ncbi:uncharacterized protein LOC126907927 isoform X2 [Daktulosphaira vitifoliae]|uniref:uncharacterized protein LOC126907927 isoform X2 n=1 Tax=Daktulosphaira vitifoliae TaxID=58002 RepID=UPI0021AAB588|nr:uncharacterized protein LOC126907927 isoform X2 [Daktulosphaira vitifoliae]
MNLYSFILVYIVVMVLKPDQGVYCRSYYTRYRLYIERFVTHVGLRIKFSEMLNQKSNSNNTTDIEKAFEPDKFSELMCNYQYTISALNYKYTIILKKFLDYIAIVMGKCQQFHERNLSENFIHCVILLVEQVKQSKTMFENLHNAMKFISYIDIRFLFSENIVLHPIIDEIEFMYQFVIEISLDTRSFDLNKSPNQESEIKFENLIKFHKDASNKVNNIFHNNNVNNNSIVSWTTINIAKWHNENNFDIVYSISNTLNKFYNETIKIWYENLGFEQFLYPTTFKRVPPKHRTINQNDGIEALKILLQESEWKSMNHINIIYCGKLFNVDHIIKDSISEINFQIKKEHVSQLLRYLCNKDACAFYHNYLIQLFNSFHKSQKMMQGLYEALIILNKSSIWNVNSNSKSSLKVISECIEYILDILKSNKFSLENFIDKNDKEKSEIVESFLEIFENFLKEFHFCLHKEMKPMHIRCSMKIPYFKKLKKINEFKNFVFTLNNPVNTSDNQNPEYYMQMILNACKYLDNFCEDVYKSCYVNLGFRKVSDCQNIKLDGKLVKFTEDFST